MLMLASITQGKARNPSELSGQRSNNLFQSPTQCKLSNTKPVE
jgi:hypothetical protein